MEASRPNGSATWRWSATAARARRRWPRPCCSRPGPSSRLGRVEDGTTVCDSEPEEQRRGQSLSLALAPFVWKGHQINLIDAPGYADFEGEALTALRVADLAVFVVSAVAGRRGADRSGSGRRRPSSGCPAWSSSTSSTASGRRSRARSTSSATGSAPAWRRSSCPSARRPSSTARRPAHRHRLPLRRPPAGTPPAPIPDDMEALEHQVHDNLVEGIVVADDDAARALPRGRGPVGRRARAHAGPRRRPGHRVPGGVRLGHRAGRHRPAGRPHLRDRSLPARPTAGRGRGRRHRSSRSTPTPPASRSLFVFKTLADPFVGQVSLFRVLSGTVRTDDHLVNPRSGTDERLHGLFRLSGPRARAGRRARRRRHRRGGQAHRHHHRRHAGAAGHAGAGAPCPRSRRRCSPSPCVARTTADEDKLANALHRLVAGGRRPSS